MASVTGLRVWRTTRAWALAGLATLLSACGASGPMWVPAVLEADASRSTASGPYQPFEETLAVGPDRVADLRFSLATLPSGTLSRLVIENNTATVSSSTYNLTAEKVFRARLVLYADEVIEPGYVRVDGLHTAGGDCFANEATPSNCASTLAGPVRAGNADDPAQAWRIAERGYHSLDVTEVVKDRIRQGYAGVLRVVSAPDPSTGSFGRFAFASKEKVMGQTHTRHAPQLLITLTDAATMASSTLFATSVQNVLADPSIADRDFSLDPNLLMNGHPAERAYALIRPRSIQTGGATMRSFLNQAGTRSYKMSMITSVNSAFPSAGAATETVTWYRTPAFNNGNARITWNNGWSVPEPSALLATNTVRPDRASQVLASDITRGYVDALHEAYVADSSTANFAVAGTTSVAGPVTIEGIRATGDGAMGGAPKFLAVLTPVPTNLPYAFDINDSTRRIELCMRHLGSATCTPSISMRARIGQNFSPSAYALNIRSILNDSNPEYVSPVNIAAPLSGPSVDLESDPDPETQDLAAGFGSTGYQPDVRRANREVGTYKAIVSIPGHNVRAEIAFENLPLPSAALSGPVRVAIPAGATSVMIPADAAQPFTLAVDDAVVNANIDDTTLWRFTSSNPSDTMPGDVRQSHGSVPVALGFGSVGPRTITVTSRGDATITATFEVIVDLQGTTTLEPQGSIPVYGQPVTLTAHVADHAGVPIEAGEVEFLSGTALLARAWITQGVVSWTTSGLGVGVHAITARHIGSVDDFVAGSSTTGTFAVDRAGSVVELSAPASVLVGDGVEIRVSVAARAPGAGTPLGTVTIGDGTTSCTVALDTANACTLTPAGSGARTLTANYAGDGNFLASDAHAPLAVLERAVLAPSLDDGRAYVAYGRVVDYAVTLRNDGLGEATAFPVAATLSAAFDGDFARWQCFGAGAGATCAASGDGVLDDLATIPPGRSLTWLVRAPVRHDTMETSATFALDVGGHDPHSLVDTNTIVLMREGFDDPYPASAPIFGDAAVAILDGRSVHAFDMPPASRQRFDDGLLVRSGAREIRVQRAWLDAQAAVVRLSVRDSAGVEQVSPWVRASASSTLAISGLRLDDGVTTVLLEGAEAPTAMTFREED